MGSQAADLDSLGGVEQVEHFQQRGLGDAILVGEEACPPRSARSCSNEEIAYSTLKKSCLLRSEEIAYSGALKKFQHLQSAGRARPVAPTSNTPLQIASKHGLACERREKLRVLKDDMRNLYVSRPRPKDRTSHTYMYVSSGD
jgi:hypothetical protein